MYLTVRFEQKTVGFFVLQQILHYVPTLPLILLLNNIIVDDDRRVRKLGFGSVIMIQIFFFRNDNYMKTFI